jgi:hypothetical protein
VLSERAISSTPENRCEPEPGQTFAVVTIRATKRQPRSRCDGEDWGTAWAKLDKLGMQLMGRPQRTITESSREHTMLLDEGDNLGLEFTPDDTATQSSKIAYLHGR